MEDGRFECMANGANGGGAPSHAHGPQALQRLSMQRRSMQSSLEGGSPAGVSPRGPTAPSEGGAATGVSGRQAELERWDPELPTNAPVSKGFCAAL